MVRPDRAVIQPSSNTGATRILRLGHPWEINGIRTGRLKLKTIIASLAMTAATQALPLLASKAEAQTYCGGASWYALRSRTASGEMMDPAALTAAHKTLPLGSTVKVTNLGNGKQVSVRINDRGPFVKGRLIDLSRGAAERLGFVGAGLATVAIETAGRTTRNCA